MNLPVLTARSAVMTAAAFALAAATAFATSAAPYSPTIVLVVPAGVLLVAAIVRRPEIGALLILVLVAIVPRSVLFDRGVPLAGGSLKVTDLLLVATLGAWIAARTLHPNRYPLPSRSVTLLVLAVLALAAVSLVTAHEMGTPRKLSLLELRPLLSYLLVFPLVSGARRWRDLTSGLAIVGVAAGVSAIVAIAEYVHGTGGVASFTSGALRVQAVVYIFPLLALVWAPVVIAYSRSPSARFAVSCLAVLALAGVFFTFARGAWVAALVTVPLVLVLLPARRRAQALRWLVSLTLAAIVSVAGFNAISARGVQDPLAAGLDRISSVGSYRNDESSLYRLAEWDRAIQEIERRPITGIGLGSSITFTNPMYSPEYNTYGFTFSTYYIHNSYIWFALKIGLFGLLLLFALVVRVCWCAYRGYKSAADPRARMVLLASLASLIALLLLSASGPHLNVDNAAPALAGLIAAVEIAWRLDPGLKATASR